MSERDSQSTVKTSNPMAQATSLVECSGGGSIPTIKIMFRTTEEMSAASDQLRALRSSGETPREPQWIVNDLGELGVMTDGHAYFLYKGDNIEYETGQHDDGTLMLYRIVGKREFGEVCYPLKWLLAGRSEKRYTENLVYTPGFSFGKPEDGDWRPLPSHVKTSTESSGKIMKEPQ